MNSRKGEVLHFLCRIVVSLMALVLVVATAHPLSHDDAWWIRVFDFPRIQIASSIGLTSLSRTALHPTGRLRPWETAHTAAAGMALRWQGWSIAPYSRVHPIEMTRSTIDDEANRISFLIFDVLADNREVEALRALIREQEPDIDLLSEPTEWWRDQLQGLESDHPYTSFSRRRTPMESCSTPTRSFSLARPAFRAPKVRANAKPVIVAGDFDDVVWSHTTHLFQRIAGLLDPRVGRGLYNSFDARSRLLRFPLDHVFASEHFMLVELRRLPDIDSDHFPIFVSLECLPAASVPNEEPQPRTGDRTEAESKIQEGEATEQAR